MHCPVYLCGDGYDIMAGENIPTVEKTPRQLIKQNAESVAFLGYTEYLMGNYSDDLSLRPIYLRAPQAERERAARLASERLGKNVT